MRLLIVDNYDSFTYNLVQYLQELLEDEIGGVIDVKRNDALTLEEVDNYDAVVISPGPGVPNESGLTKPIIEAYTGRKPILGVCLGLQAIVEVFGGEIINLDDVHHGVYSMLEDVNEDPLFKNIERPMQVGRYHSWVAKAETLPKSLLVIARDNLGQVMAVRHKSDATVGVQFHPESILTPDGKVMLANFLDEARAFQYSNR